MVEEEPGGRLLRSFSAANAGGLASIDPAEVSALLGALMAQEWVVYTKLCLQRTESVIGFLARFTHRIALGNARIPNLDGKQVLRCHRQSRNPSRADHARCVGASACAHCARSPGVPRRLAARPIVDALTPPG